MLLATELMWGIRTQIKSLNLAYKKSFEKANQIMLYMLKPDCREG